MNDPSSPSPDMRDPLLPSSTHTSSKHGEWRALHPSNLESRLPHGSTPIAEDSLSIGARPGPSVWTETEGDSFTDQAARGTAPNSLTKAVWRQLEPERALKSFQVNEFIQEFKDEFLPNRAPLERLSGGANVLHFSPKEEEGFAVMSVTIRPRQYWDVGMLVAVVYSYIPHSLLPIFLIRICFYKDLFSLEGFVLMSLVATINDVGVKRIYKEARPITSRAHGYGMPSSHCACSYATMLWSIYEIWFGEAGEFPTHKLPVPLQDIFHPLTPVTAFLSSILMIILFLPMPWARVKVGDHTVKQSIMGSFVGLCVGLFYCLAVLEGGAEWWLTREWFKSQLKQLHT